jgi:hypothetical protein
MGAKNGGRGVGPCKAVRQGQGESGAGIAGPEWGTQDPTRLVLLESHINYSRRNQGIVMKSKKIYIYKIYIYIYIYINVVTNLRNWFLTHYNTYQ